MCPARQTTNSQEPVKVECPIIFWLGVVGALILAGFAGVAAWNCWLTVKQADMAASEAAAKVVDDATNKRLDEMREDVKELLRRTPPSRVSATGGGG